MNPTTIIDVLEAVIDNAEIDGVNEPRAAALVRPAREAVMAVRSLIVSARAALGWATDDHECAGCDGGDIHEPACTMGDLALALIACGEGIGTPLFQDDDYADIIGACDFCGAPDATRTCLDCGHVYCNGPDCIEAHEAIAAADQRSRG